MQLSKENSDAGGCTGTRAARQAAGRPGALGRGCSPPTAPRPGTAELGDPRALSPAHPARRKLSSEGTRAGAGTAHRAAAERSRAPKGSPAGSARGPVRSTPDGPGPAGRQTGVTTRFCKPRSPPSARRGPRPYLATACGCHPGPARASSSLYSPHARQPAAFKSPGYPAGRGERACALGCGREAGRGPAAAGVRRGGWRGGARTRGERAGGLAAVFVAAAATRSPRVAPRRPCH